MPRVLSYGPTSSVGVGQASPPTGGGTSPPVTLCLGLESSHASVSARQAVSPAGEGTSPHVFVPGTCSPGVGVRLAPAVAVELRGVRTRRDLERRREPAGEPAAPLLCPRATPEKTCAAGAEPSRAGPDRETGQRPEAGRRWRARTRGQHNRALDAHNLGTQNRGSESGPALSRPVAESPYPTDLLRTLVQAGWPD